MKGEGHIFWGDFGDFRRCRSLIWRGGSVWRGKWRGGFGVLHGEVGVNEASHNTN